ncbi:MAG: PD-(D/E)XK nuclease family protein [Planctomycetota bacterium]
MILYPSNMARDAALTKLPDAAWTQGHSTFSEFSADLDRLLPFGDADAKPRREARGVGRFALFAQAVRQDPEQLERVAGSERALKSAGALIASWKAASLRPDDILKAASELETAPQTARVGGITQRLARLFELYERQLGKDWTDRESSERSLLRRLEACERIPQRLLKSGESVELSGFHKLAYVQFRIVTKLLRLKHDVIVRSPIFSSDEQRTAFSGLIKTFGGARFIASNLSEQATSTITRMEATSPYAEVYEIGRRVRRWITDEKIAPSDIAIMFRDLGQYSQSIHDVFKRLGVPFYERRGEPASFQPLVRVALSAMDACVEGLDRRSVFRFLCAGPVNVGALANTPKTIIDPDALRALALEVGIDRARDDADANPVEMWSSKLKRFISAGKSNKRGYLATALVTIIERLNSMRGDRSAHAHVQAWRAFFDVSGLSAATLAPGAAGTTPLKERLAIGTLEAALKSVEGIPNATTEKISLATFSELVNAAMQEQSIRADGLERGGVHVLNFFDARGLRFKRVVIGGMAEGLCPARPGSDPLLGQGAEHALRKALASRVNDRETVAHLAPRLSHEIEEEERALFNGAIACAETDVLLTRSERGFDGGAIGASEFWDVFHTPIEKSAPIHPAPVLSDCITPEESELRAAWVLGGGVGIDLILASPFNESTAALDAYASVPRLKSLARFAAVERARYHFFLDQSVASAQNEKGVGDGRAKTAASIYDGVVSAMAATTVPGHSAEFAALETEIAKRLAPGGIGDPMLGPSDLEKLAACPFQFLLERACRFQTSEEPGDEASPLDIGDLWHAVLNRFYKEELEHAAQAGALTARLDKRMRAAYLNRLLFFAGEELFKTSSEKFIGHPGFWKLQDERVRTVLGSWLDCELQETDGFYPAHVEFDFGPEAVSGGTELKVALHPGAAMALRIKGRMDRLDFKTELRDGCDTIVAVRVIDYKLGRGHRYAAKTKIDGLSSLLSAQLPIYVAAAVDYLHTLRAERDIAVDFDSVWNDSRAGYYSLRDTPFSSHGDRARLVEVKEWPLGNLREFLNSSAPEGSGALYDLARAHVSGVLSGRFPVQPLDCSGLYCSARYACRYQAIPAMEEEE